jgi:lysophospholipase L1-like esterase
MKIYISLLTALFPFYYCIAQDATPPRFASEIEAFAEMDKQKMPEKDKIVFVGSSSIRMWKEAEEKFEAYGVINRGFGGSQTSDAINYFNELVLKYEPKQIFFYEGDNDIAAGKSPKQVLKDFKVFVGIMEADLLNCELAFIAIKPSIARWQMAKAMMKANKLIKKYCDKKANLTYVDVWTPMIGTDGKPLPDIFIGDNLHMNAKGYAIWNKTIMPFLKK